MTGTLSCAMRAGVPEPRRARHRRAFDGEARLPESVRYGAAAGFGTTPFPRSRALPPTVLTDSPPPTARDQQERCRNSRADTDQLIFC